MQMFFFTHWNILKNITDAVHGPDCAPLTAAVLSNLYHGSCVSLGTSLLHLLGLTWVFMPSLPVSETRRESQNLPNIFRPVWSHFQLPATMAHKHTKVKVDLNISYFSGQLKAWDSMPVFSSLSCLLTQQTKTWTYLWSPLCGHWKYVKNPLLCCVEFSRCHTGQLCTSQFTSNAGSSVFM